MAQLYRNTGSLNPARSVFNESYEVKGSADLGLLIPVMCKSCCPGDIWEIGQEMVLRWLPLVNPILHEINLYTWTFFVPYRLIDEDWEEFVGGGWDGQSLPDGEHPIELPTWSGNTSMPIDGGKYSLWDYLGFPNSELNNNAPPPKILPIDYPLRAMNFIYSMYMRDENLEPEIEYPYDAQAVVEADSDPKKPGNGTYTTLMGYPTTNLFWGNWEKDYFTCALPFQQRGVSPALPLYGSAEVENMIINYVNNWTPSTVGGTTSGYFLSPNGVANTKGIVTNAISPSENTNIINAFVNYLNGGKISGNVDLTTATAGDVNDLRWAFQLQKFMERNARIGVRYVELLHGRYGQPLLDVRLDRPEYIGGSRTPIIISEVLQTGQTNATSPNNNNQLGSMGGHGITANKSYIGKYKVREFGLIMTIMCIKPKPAYAPQGLDREWAIRTPYDLIIPEFVNLSEQGILNQELIALGTDNDLGIGGFIGRNDEYRSSQSKVVGLMNSPSYRTWHLARYLPTDASICTPEFIKINPIEQRRANAVTSMPPILFNFGNILKGVRPLPIIAEPGLIDHH